MPRRDLTWAIAAARIIVSKGLAYEPNDALRSLLTSLTHDPPPCTWGDVLRSQNPSRQQIKRALDSLSDAVASISFGSLASQPMINARVRAQHELTLAALMRIGGALDAAVVGYHHVVEVSNRYHLTDCSIAAASALRQMAIANNNQHEYRRYDRIIKRLNDKRHAEVEASALEDKARSLLFSYHRGPEKTGAELASIVDGLERLAKTYDSVPIMRSYYRVAQWHASIITDPKRMLRVIDSFERWIQEHPEISIPADRVEVQSVRMSAHFLAGNYQAARRSWTRAQEILTRGTQNWAGILQLYFLVCTYARQYNEARDLLTEFDKHQVRKIPLWRRQELEVYRAYVHLLIEHDVIEAGSFAEGQGTYISRLEKNSDELLRDKPIMNAALLILRVFQHLKNRRKAEIVVMTESLRTYASKYLRNRQTQRTGRFLRLLASLPACEFKRDRFLLKQKQLHEKYPDADMLKRDDGEIIPYETLEWILANKLLR